jgi:proline dehydrogenase
MVDFSNTKIAFQSKSDSDLRRAYWLFRLVENPSLVAFGKKALQFSFKIGLPVKPIIKATVFSQFCGGETIDECRATITHMASFGVGSILDYSVEGNESEAAFEETLRVTLETIQFAGTSNKFVPTSVFKPTGIGRFELYEKLNRGDVLSDLEGEEWDRVRKRFYAIAQAAEDAGVPVMVDAEESWIQGAIDSIVLELMMHFNKAKPVVFNTLQMYRHDRLAYLENTITHAKAHGYFPGFKIVRGAYMEKERQRAIEMGYPDPIQPDKAATDRDYNAAISLILKSIDSVHLVAGTHNDESSALLVKLMEQFKVDKKDHRVYFSQLFGMSDHLSFNLAASGYNVVKYLPFGPVKEVMPYLFRRAEENTSVAGQTGRELLLISKERARRKNQ